MSAVDDTTRRMKEAVEKADLEAFMATISADVVLRSPISEKVEFHGREEMRELMRGVFDTIEDIEYYEELGDERGRALFYRGRVGAQPIEEASLLRFDDAGQIRELTLWIRPLPGLTRLAAALGPRLARENSRTKAALVAAAARSLAFLTAIGDGPLVKLVRPKRSR
jgi:hypothetical protein